jgi:hypothetical protein
VDEVLAMLGRIDNDDGLDERLVIVYYCTVFPAEAPLPLSRKQFFGAVILVLNHEDKFIW